MKTSLKVFLTGIVLSDPGSFLLSPLSIRDCASAASAKARALLRAMPGLLEPSSPSL